MWAARGHWDSPQAARLTRWVWGFSGSCHPPLAAKRERGKEGKKKLIQKFQEWRSQMYDLNSYRSYKQGEISQSTCRAVSRSNYATAPTHWFVSHSNIPGGPATKTTGEVVRLLHGGFGWVIRYRGRNVSGPSWQRVHAAWTIETICAPRIQTDFWGLITESHNTVGNESALSVTLVHICCILSTLPVLFQLSLCRGHVF